eukprot:GFYU01042785.1.p1 GENE.GFYU01042785.1~~GFYU01042785.1.p1  ORF type:complete len:160 (+),score=27.78 GFYU01042785.1:26-481(+)
MLDWVFLASGLLEGGAGIVTIAMGGLFGPSDPSNPNVGMDAATSGTLVYNELWGLSIFSFLVSSVLLHFIPADKGKWAAGAGFLSYHAALLFACMRRYTNEYRNLDMSMKYDAYQGPVAVHTAFTVWFAMWLLKHRDVWASGNTKGSKKQS